MQYNNKYLKYKQKYLLLKGGTLEITLDQIEKIIIDKTDINIQEYNNIERIFLAAVKINRVDIIKFLVEKGANINLQMNVSPLIFAIMFNKVDSVKCLVENGADIEIQIDGMSPLIYAVTLNNFEIVKILVEKGVDINLQNRTGKNAYFIACEERFTEIALYLLEKNPDLVQNKNESNQQCIIDKPKKTANELDLELIKSVPVKYQENDDCFIHAVCRNIIRTLQMLGAFTSSYNDQFYHFFYAIIVNQYSCDGGYTILAMIYLLEYLYQEIENDEIINKFSIPLCIGETCISDRYYKDKTITLTIHDLPKNHFIETMKQIKPYLYIQELTYTPKEIGKNYPTQNIKKMLKNRLQPLVLFKYSQYLDNDDKELSNLVPIFTENESNDETCVDNTYGHGLNLRKWTSDYVELKNSWDTNIYNNGNFSISDIRLLTCDTQKSIRFICLMFDESIFLIENIKEINNRIQSLFGDHVSIEEHTNEDTIKSDIKYKFIDSNIYGYGKYKYDDDKIYEGDWKDYKKDGHGTLYFSDGKIEYEGNWKDDKKDGHGISYYSNGHKKYEGYWKDGKKDGHGTLYYNNRIKQYEGDWKDDKKDGHGTFYLSNGIKEFEGVWKDDIKKDGYGIFDLSFVGKYEGDWKDGKQNGHGTLFLSDGKRYEGDWKDGTKDGHGTLYLSDGKKEFEGNWKDGTKKDGNGIFNLSSDEIYEGDWKDGKQNGIGILYTSHYNIVYSGNWKDGKYNGHGIYYYNNKKQYEGDWKDNKKDGYGTLYLSNGNVEYDGNWHDDKKEGQGILYYFDGRKEYEGEWKDNKKDGYGILYYSNEKQEFNEWEEWEGDMKEYEGNWKDDKKNGTGILYYKYSNDEKQYEGNWSNDERI